MKRVSNKRSRIWAIILLLILLLSLIVIKNWDGFIEGFHSI